VVIPVPVVSSDRSEQVVYPLLQPSPMDSGSTIYRSKM
jgi:hypothetical protein